MKRCSQSDSIGIRNSDRRNFLMKFAGGATALGITTIASPVATKGKSISNQAADEIAMPTSSGDPRAEQAFEMRHKAALNQRNAPRISIVDNGDEVLYVDRVGNYSKALPHNSVGQVEESAYTKMLRAIHSGYPADFENIPLGGKVLLSNPQAAFTYCLEGSDSHQFAIPAPPTFSSAETAGEMIELYWQALIRDVPFTEYDKNPLTLKAADELSKLSNFRGPRVNGKVTHSTLFRGITPDDLKGPYISQFLLKQIQYGSIPVTQRIRTLQPEVDFMTTFSDWLAIQNGTKTADNRTDPTLRYISTARDLAAFVHEDFTYQACLNACLILMAMKVPFDMSDPYMMSKTQSGFSTFGPPHVLDVLAKVANAGLRAAWYQKWLIHRRLRPEEFGGAIHRTQTGITKYRIHDDVLKSDALAELFSRNGTYLLPQAYREGCPTHPSYPAGHAVIAGACATVLKAFFEESFVIREPVIANSNGLSLISFNGEALTVGGELNKLAANISFARNAAGVHWRSDAAEGLRLGEAVAIEMMAEGSGCITEDFSGLGLTKFDGTTIVV